MGIQTIAGAAFRALTVRKDGPSLYDVCDPVLLKYRGGDPHLGKFYRTALGNPALRPLLRRTGLPALRDEGRLQALREALTRARDDAEPDWAAVGAPIAELMADINVRHPEPAPAAAPARAPDLAAIEKVIRRCGAHLLRSFERNGFIPTYAAFNLIGDPDHGRARDGGRADRAELARLQELDAAFQPGADLHRAFAGAGADQPALDGDRRADVAADADPAPLGLLRRLLHRGAAELRRDRAGLGGRGHGLEARHRGDGRFLPEDLGRGSALA